MSLFNRIFGKKESSSSFEQVAPVDELRLIFAELEQPPRKAQDISRFIKLCRRALELLPKEKHPEQWAYLQLALAYALFNNMQGENRAEELEQAIKHYNLALEVYTRSTDPENWAMTLQNLGAAYSKRIRGVLADNIEKAIGFHNQSLEVRTRIANPKDWAMTHNNLGGAYLIRIRGEHAENIELAIKHFNLSLEVRDSKSNDKEWIGVKHNMGAAFVKRIHENRMENIEQAIKHLKEALRVCNHTTDPTNWALLHNALGDTYVGRIHENKEENIKQAIEHCTQALEVYSRTFYPEKWAGTQNNLANAYAERKDQAESLEKAIVHYTQSLDIYTRTSFPADWAKVQVNLGKVYAQRIYGVRTDNIEKAIKHYTQALEVRNRTALPFDYRNTQRNLGNLYFTERRWAEALKAYRAALSAGDDLLAAASTEIGRRAEVGETTELYSRASYCLLQEGQFSQALLMYEHGKTRILSEALALSDADISIPSKDQQKQMVETRTAVRELEAEMRLPQGTPSRRDDRELAEKLRQARSDLKTLIDTIHEDHPNFMPKGLEMQEILALIPENGALVVPLVTSQGSAVFVVPNGIHDVTEKHVILLDEFKGDKMTALIMGTENKPGWIRTYLQHNNTEKLLSVFDRITEELWISLLAPIHDRLQSLNIKSVILMPAGGLQLLPLHAAWRMENNQRRYLLDDYDAVVYAPSGFALETSRRRAAHRDGHSAMIVGINKYADSKVNPLVNATPEAQAIAELLKTEPLLDGDATKEAIKKGAEGNAYLHLSCHGYFDWNKPLASGLICYDQPLKLSEIIGEINLDSTRLVTLSACETGITDIQQSPDEYVGLPAGFLQAGAPAVVSSLWAVDDRSTALLMGRFYRNHIEAGMALPVALRNAQLWLRDVTKQEIGDYYKNCLRMSKPEAQKAWMELDSRFKNPDDRPYSHPFYWAAFTFTGA